MKQIVLLNGGHTTVNDEDYEAVSQYRWRRNRLGYVCAYVKGPGKPARLSLHRLILKAEHGQEVDHVDGDKLNNQRSNLRFCTRQENMRNLRRVRGLADYKGISQVRSGSWVAQIRVEGVPTYLGTFRTAQAAARAYDAAARFHFGAFAATNFPDGECLPAADIRLRAMRQPGRGFYRDGGAWRVVLRIGGKRCDFGRYKNEIEAAWAVQRIRRDMAPATEARRVPDSRLSP